MGPDIPAFSGLRGLAVRRPSATHAALAASAKRALAPSTGAPLAGRALQGVGAAATLPASLAIIAERFPAGTRRARALGVWGGVSGAGLAAGPVLGGEVASAFGWRAVFLMVVPAAALSALLIAGEADPARRAGPERIAVAGHTLAALALVLVTAALTQASVDGSTGRRTCALGGAAAIVALARVLVGRRRPMLPADVRGRRAFNAAIGTGALFNFTLYGTLFCLSLHLAQADRLPARTAGLVLAPLTTTVAIAALLSGRMSARFGARRAMLGGLAGGGLGAALLTVVGSSADPPLVAALGALLGSAGLAMPAMTSVVLAASPPGHVSLGAALLNASRQTGGAFGVALLGTFAGPDGTRLTLPMATVTVAYLAAAATTAAAIRS